MWDIIMPIRKEDDALSRATIQKKDYFKRQDTSQSNLNFDRFIYMLPGNKSKFYDWRLDLSTNSNIEFTKFVIDHEKFVNRPDAISYDVYGNAKYWWVIAMANSIKDPFFEFYKGRELKIPDIQTVKKELGL